LGAGAGAASSWTAAGLAGAGAARPVSTE
jgi:hypothetical protein